MGAFFRDAPQAGPGEPRSHSGLARHLSRELSLDAAAMLHAGASYFFHIGMVGGAVADVDPMDTAHGWREANFAISALGTARSGLDQGWSRLLPYLEGMYVSFETDTGADALTRAFPPAHLTRLTELKRRYDPAGLFRDNFPIPFDAAI